MRLAPSADLRCRAVERFGLDPREGPCAADMASQAVCAAVGAAVGAAVCAAVGAASVSSQSALLGAGLQVAGGKSGARGPWTSWPSFAAYARCRL